MLSTARYHDRILARHPMDYTRTSNTDNEDSDGDDDDENNVEKRRYILLTDLRQSNLNPEAVDNRETYGKFKADYSLTYGSVASTSAIG